MKHERTLVRRVSRILGAAQLALLLVLAWAIPTQAAETTISYISGGTVALCYYPQQASSWDNQCAFLIPSGKVSNVKVSKKAVLGFSQDKFGTSHYYLALELKKAGTSRLTYTYKGKSHKVTIVAKKYANPCTKLMLDSTNIAPKFNTMHDAYVQRTAKRKIKVAPKAGWKIEGIYCQGASGATKKLTNGGKIPAKCKYVWVDMLETKSKMKVRLNIYAN